MPCPDPGPGADFFNNVAAVAVVLMFAKVVSHRSRKADYNPKWAKRLAHAHVAAVLLAVAAVVICLLVTDGRVAATPAWLNTTWALLGLSAAILVCDVSVDAYRDSHTKADTGGTQTPSRKA